MWPEVQQDQVQQQGSKFDVMKKNMLNVFLEMDDKSN